MKKVGSLLLSFALLLSISNTSTYANTNNRVENLGAGDYVEFGRYNEKSITWQVVDLGDSDDGVVLLADEILTQKAYDAAESGNYGIGSSLKDQYGSPEWYTSNIRNWLNSGDNNVAYLSKPPKNKACSNMMGYDSEKGFLSNFTPYEQQALIKRKTADVIYDPKTTGGSFDKVFLLSELEFLKIKNENINVSYETPWGLRSALSDRNSSSVSNMKLNRLAYPNVTDDTIKTILQERKYETYGTTYRTNYWGTVPTLDDEVTEHVQSEGDKITYVANGNFYAYDSSAYDISGNYVNLTFNRTFPSDPIGIRPAIYLNKALYLTGGDGSKEKPYTVGGFTEGIALDKRAVTLKAKQTIKLNSQLLPSNSADKNVIWRSSNTSVAKVDSTGVVRTIRAGKTTITATTHFGNYTATCDIVVK